MDFFSINLQRQHSPKEDIIVSFLIFGLSLSIVYSRIFSGTSAEKFLLIILPICMIASLLSIGSTFLTKYFYSRRFGYKIDFSILTLGLIMSLLTSIFGFIISLPGISRIRNINNKEIEGKISLLSPAINMVIGLVFMSISFFSSGLLEESMEIIGGSNLVVAFINLLPFPPLDGFTILRWNFYIYIVVLAFSITFIVTLSHGFI